MSLTWHLKDVNSPVRKYLEKSFPILQQTKRGETRAKEFSRILGFDALPVCVLPTLAPESPQGTIGIAVDYRLRYYFQAYDANETVAAHGVERLPGKAAMVGRKFLDQHNALVERLSPVGRQLNRLDENALNRSCVILAWFETVVRSGEVFPKLNSYLQLNKVEGLISAVEHEVVQDINQLSLAFASDASELFKLNSILNPRFEGSIDVGGADADMIVDKALVDFKCTSKLDAAKLRDAALQMLGYVLLDYGGKYAVSDLLVYLPRQRYSWSMPLWKFVLAPDAVLEFVERGNKPKTDLVEKQLLKLRIAFRKLARSL